MLDFLCVHGGGRTLEEAANCRRPNELMTATEGYQTTTRDKKEKERRVERTVHDGERISKEAFGRRRGKCLEQQSDLPSFQSGRRSGQSQRDAM